MALPVYHFYRRKSTEQCSEKRCKISLYADNFQARRFYLGFEQRYFRR